MNEELYFSIKDFSDKIEASALNYKDQALATEAEIRRVENLKINIVDDNIIGNPEAAIYVSGQIDSYILKLQELLCENPTKRISIDTLSTEALRLDRNKGLEQVEALGQSE